MNRFNPRLWGVLAAAVVASLALTASAGAVTPSAVYDATPSPLPPNVASLGYEATSTSEFGDKVHLAGTNRVLDEITVTMSDWALKSDYPTVGTATSWQHPITVNVYTTGLTLLASKTETITIPWRPAADPTCAGGTAWRASDGLCYNGIAFNATFDMPNVTLPNDVIVGIAYNTQHYGATPLGVPGPYNSLNVGIPTGQTAIGRQRRQREQRLLEHVLRAVLLGWRPRWHRHVPRGHELGAERHGGVQDHGHAGPGRSADQQGPVQERRLEDLQQPGLREPGRVRQLRRVESLVPDSRKRFEARHGGGESPRRCVRRSRRPGRARRPELPAALPGASRAPSRRARGRTLRPCRR